MTKAEIALRMKSTLDTFKGQLERVELRAGLGLTKEQLRLIREEGRPISLYVKPD